MKRLLTRFLLPLILLSVSINVRSQCAGNTTAPTISTCPANLTMNANAVSGNCYRTMNGADQSALYPVAFDDCSSPPQLIYELTYVGPGGAVGPLNNPNLVGVQFQVGTTFMQWRVYDPQGNPSVLCQYTLTITDVTPPSILVGGLSCGAVGSQSVNANSSCKYLQSGSSWNATATDNCSVSTLTYSSSGAGVSPATGSTLTGAQFNLGATTITWTATDNATPPNTSTCSFTVVVSDVTPPVPTVAVLPGLSDQCSVTPTAPTALDNCPASGTSITGTTNTTFPITAQGVTTVIWTYTDGSGNSTTQTQIVTIDDITAPVPTLAALPDITAQCTVPAPTPPTASDNCDPTITGTTSTSFPITTQGTTVITWIYDDGNGNSTTQTQNVIIDDITAPVADVPSLTTVTAQCSASPSAPTATDNCVGSVTATTSTSMPITASTTITWVYSDGNGNTSTQTQNVVINDITAPVPDVASLPTINSECTTLSVPTATDNCLGAVTATTSDPITYNQDGTYVVTWTYTDGNGNSISQTQTIIINDVTNPVPNVASLPDIVQQCATLTPPTALDNCVGTITATTSDPTTYTADGTYVVTWSYTDGNGNTVTQTQNVIIDDVTGPVPDSPNIDFSGECTVLTAPTATDACVPGTITGTTSDPTSFSVDGTYTVVWSYSDGNGNTTTQTQIVQIDDVTVPVPTVLALSDLTAECSVPAPLAPTASDNCSGTLTATTTTVFPVTAQGTTVVTWLYDDGNGNTTTQTQNVIIDDITAPVPNVSSLPTVTAECTANPTVPQATDNCVGFVTATTSTTLPVTASTVITWVYDDGNGNTTTQTQNVVINDVTAPVPNVASLPTITGQCVTLTPPTATDNCLGNVTATTSSPTTYTADGSYVVTWTYTDGNNNSVTQIQIVIINDITAPVPDVASLPNVLAECITLTPPTATDNCVGSVTATTADPLTYDTDGTYQVTWSYTDGNGNTVTQTQTVIIDDATAPVADLANIDYAGGCLTLTPPTATDACVGAITGTTTDPTTYNADGTYIVTWTYDDGNGNTSTQSQFVVINDVTPPVADNATLSNLTAECSITPTAPTATDDCAGTVTVTSLNTFPINTQGTTVVTWVYDDGNGNTTTQTQTVIIDDITAPVPDVASLPNLTGECAVTVTTIPTASDNCLGTLNASTTDPLNYTSQGTYTITWTYNDFNGNTSTQTQTVIVDDVTAPVPDLATLPTLTGECSVNVTVIPTSTDNCVGAVTATTTSPLSYNVEGTYTVIWSYDDSNGNIGTQSQTVIVDDVTAPVPDVASLPVISAECITLTPPTATDNCEGAIVATTADPLTYNSDGTYVVTWVYDDTNGNTVTQTQTVIIDDVTLPVPDQANIDYSGDCLTLTPPTATDNCVGQISGTTSDPVSYVNDGTYVVTWTYDDGNGNSVTQTQTVIIDDVTIPVLPTLANAVAQCDTTITAPVALDNCVGPVTGTTTDPLNYAAQGTYTITWLFDDTNGNTVTATQTVIIDDVTAPEITAPVTVDVYPNNAGCTAVGVVLGIPITNDNCLVDTVFNNAPSIYPLGATTVVWTVTDIGGNTSTATQTVNVLPLTSTIDTVACDVYISPEGIDLTSFGSGTYTAVIPGSFGCDSTITINLTLNQSTTAEVTLSSCDTYTAPDGAIYNNSGVYTAIIENAVGCDSVITINLTIDSIETAAVALNDLVFTALQATQVQYQWVSCDNGYSAISGATQQNFDISQYPLPSGEYAVVLTNNTCIDTSACVNVSIETIIPQLVTANGDGNNDVFEIQGVYDYPNNILEIFNRWGSLVYRQEGYQNTWGGECTEGLTLGGDILPTGTYFYVFDKGLNDGSKPTKGYIFLTK